MPHAVQSVQCARVTNSYKPV